MNMQQALGVLAGLSSAQWGLFTSSQAACRGVSRLELSRLAESVLHNAVGRRVDPRDPIVGESGAQVGPIVRNRTVDSGTLVETDNDGRVMR